MSDSNYQASTIKLEALYKSALNSHDNRGFFSHLYRYLEYIFSNDTLEASAWQLFSSAYSLDHDDFEREYELGVGTFEEHFTKPINDYRGDSRLYNGWLHLFIFYSANTMQSGLKTLSAQSQNATNITKILQHEMRSAKYRLDNSGNTSLDRSDFSLYLEVFHQDFIGWLSEGAAEFGNTSSELLTEVELSFDDIYPVVTLKSTGEVYKFRRMVQSKTPYKIIKLLFNNPGIVKSADTLPVDIKLSKKGLIESLRGSDFYPNDGVLALFLTVQKRPAKLMLHRKRRLTGEQLEKLAAIAGKPTTNS